MAQVDFGTKRNVIELVKNCMLDVNGLITKSELNVLPLGLYEALIGMDWLESHRVVIKCLDKTFTYIDDEGRDGTVRRIPRLVFLRKIHLYRQK